MPREMLTWALTELKCNREAGPLREAGPTLSRRVGVDAQKNNNKKKEARGQKETEPQKAENAYANLGHALGHKHTLPKGRTKMEKIWKRDREISSS